MRPPASIPPVTVADPVTGIVGDYALPLDAYMTTPDQIRDLDNAAITLQNDCLQRFGFTGRIPLKGDAPTFLSKINPGRFGPTDPAEAQTSGYHSPRTRAPRPAPPGGVPLTEAETALIGGTGPKEIGGTPVPEGGCLREAKRKLAEGGPPEPADPSFARNLAARLLGPVSQDARLVAAQTRWSTCMKTAGYTYKDTTEAMTDPKWTTATPTGQEIQTAVADARCKKETNLSDTGIAVWTAYEQQAVEQHAEELTAYKAWLANSTRNAARVLAGR